MSDTRTTGQPSKVSSTTSLVGDGGGIEKRSRNTEEWIERTLLWKRKATFCAMTTMFPSSNQTSESLLIVDVEIGVRRQ